MTQFCNERKMIIITLPPSFPKGVKNAKRRFPSKSRTLLEESLLQSLCENCQRQSCNVFIGWTIRAKMIGGATPST